MRLVMSQFLPENQQVLLKWLHTGLSRAFSGCRHDCIEKEAPDVRKES